ncbi:restriction endonuclease subunit S [Aureimonas sp. N4]|uniref:restriction endonuclease subunit S n=1 Tax=Aureimonas sp. N4 TaxID=1638165 RepID=UPI0009E7F764|nr:restriction endonuclease subunit S [Aureimonas sp. N4]
MARSSLFPASVQPGKPILPLCPHGWTTVKFGDVLQIVERPTELIDNVEYQLVTAKRSRGGVVARSRLLGRDVLTKTQFLIARDDFLMSNRQIIHGGCGIVPPALDGAVVSNEYSVLRPKSELLLEFLGYFSHSIYFQQTCFHASVGVDVEKMIFDCERWLEFRFHLPPLHEQRRIVEIMSSADEAIAATRAVIEQTRKVKQGVLEHLLTRGIGHTRFKQTDIGEIPEGWEVAEVQEHFHVQLGKMLSKAARISSSPSPYLRNANVQWGQIDTEDLLYMDFSEQEKQKFRLQEGDLLVCEGGDVGRCAIWNDGREMYYQKALHRLREKTGAVKNQFIMYVLVRIFKSKALSAGLVGTNSIAHFTREQFLRMKFPVPGTEEQNAICETLMTLDDSTGENASKQEALLNLKSALMSDLLTGRKRVTDARPLAAE